VPFINSGILLENVPYASTAAIDSDILTVKPYSEGVKFTVRSSESGSLEILEVEPSGNLILDPILTQAVTGGTREDINIQFFEQRLVARFIPAAATPGTITCIAHSYGS